jgi:hypothetical protein
MPQKLNAAIAVIGIDIGKNSFHLVGHDHRGTNVLRQKWSRGQVETRLANLPPCLIGMEACVGAHHLSRKLQMLGHDARLMPAKYVRPYSKGQKNDFRDAEAIAEAVQRPTMKFVATKTADQLDLQALHRVRERLVGQRTGVIDEDCDDADADVRPARGDLATAEMLADEGLRGAIAACEQIVVDPEGSAGARGRRPGRSGARHHRHHGGVDRASLPAGGVAGSSGMSKKDDARIMVALRDGHAFRRKIGITTRVSWGCHYCYEYIEHQDGRRRYVNWPNLKRLRDAGLIEHLSDVPDGHIQFEVERIENWTLAAAGQAAAAALPAIPVDVMFAVPKPTPPEKLEAARHKLKARKIASALTFNKARIRDRRVKFTGGVGLVDAFNGDPGAASRGFRRHRRQGIAAHHRGRHRRHRQEADRLNPQH